VFDLYAQKKYPDVITGVPQLVKQYPGNKLSAQLYYLKTIAEGHNEKIAPFADSLKQIAKAFPDDRLITPLVTRQLAYINTNLAELQARPVVLTDDNPEEIPFTLDRALQKETAYRPTVDPNAINQPQVRIERQQQIATEQAKPALPKINATILPPVKQPMVVKKEVQQITPPVEQPAKQPEVIAQQPAPVTPPAKPPVKPDTVAPPVKLDTIAQTVQQNIVITPTTDAREVKADVITSVFTMHDSTNYFFAVNVKSGTTNLASSRFGFGQFIRANYPGKGIKHQLLPVGADNQVIYVGRFTTLADAKKYAREVIPLLPDIMKVPKDKYSFFIISQENLNKLADAKLLDSYLDYYQKNF
jgi:hypothetical protein